MDISITYLILIVVFGILLPLNGVLLGHRTRRLIVGMENGRMMFYKQTTGLQILMAILVLGALALNEDPISSIGLSFVFMPWKIAALFGLCFLGWWVISKYQFNEQKLREWIQNNQAIKFLLPTSDQELRWSIAVSFAAGTVEEIVFRGFLFWQFSHFMPIIPAMLLANVLFGMCHYGSGLKNAFFAFSLGVLFSIIFWYTGSLWIPMLVHVLVDIYSMTRGRRYFQFLSHEIDGDI